MARSTEIRSGHSILLFVLAIASGVTAFIVSTAAAPPAESGGNDPWVWFLAGTAVVCAVGGILADAILSAATASVHRMLSTQASASPATGSDTASDTASDAGDDVA